MLYRAVGEEVAECLWSISTQQAVVATVYSFSSAVVQGVPLCEELVRLSSTPVGRQYFFRRLQTCQTAMCKMLFHQELALYYFVLHGVVMVVDIGEEYDEGDVVFGFKRRYSHQEVDN